MTEFLQFQVSVHLFFCCCSGWVPCSSSVHRAPGKKAAVPIYKVLVRPKRTHLPLDHELVNKQVNMTLRANEQGDDAPLPAFQGMRLINILSAKVWAGE